MAYTNTLTTGGDLGGVTMTATISRPSTNRSGYNGTLPLAKAGTLTTRASDTAGTLTVVTGHSILTGDLFDIYWSGGACYKAIAGEVAAAPNDTAIPFTGAAGDVLPADESAVTFQEQELHSLVFSGDDAECLSIACAGEAIVCFYASSTLQTARHISAGENWIWLSGQFETNPVAGDAIDQISVTGASATVAQTIRVGVGHDA